VSESQHLRFPNNEKARQLASVLSKKGMRAEENQSIPRRPVYSPCPASFAQQRLWLLEQMSPGSRYNLQVVLRFEERLNLETLNAAWREVLKRHEILRTTFGVVDDQIMQFISHELQPSPTAVDLTHDHANARESVVRHLIAKQAQEPFDLANGPLVRPVVFKLGAEECILSLTMHHIISDGWSMAVLERELTTLYAAFRDGQANPLPPLAIQYADFAWWQRRHLNGAFLEKQLGYWRKQLSDAPVSKLPADHPRPTRETSQGCHLHFCIPGALAEQLRELGRRNQASLFMVLLAAWQVLLYRYNAQSDVVVGAPIANRTRLEIEPLIGFFVNTLVLRTDLSGNPAFTEALARVRRTTLDAYEHQDVPYEKLVAELQPQRAASHTPFFGTILNWVNTPASSEFAGTRSGSIENAAIKFDLTLNVLETNGALPASIEYSTELYEAATITRVVEHLQKLLSGIPADPDGLISELPLLGQEERNQLLVSWNQTGAPHFPDETMLELLEEQARKTPQDSAVIFDGKSLSYRELHQQANRVANFLRKSGVKPEVPVGICMERNSQLIPALLGILKAGGGYVPLDPKYPAERLRYILADCIAPMFLTQQKLSGLLSYTGIVVKLDTEWEEISKQSSENPPITALPENLAYVIYTSGSTGRPKGVAIRNGSAAAMLRWAHQTFTQQELACVLASTSICFDLSVFEIFAPLSCGGTVLLCETALELPKMEDARKITLINTVPSVMRELVRSRTIPEAVRVANLAGEALPYDLVRDVYSTSRVQRVFNLYGPSEDTTYSTYASLEREVTTAPIGRPIAGTQAYVLDEWMQPVPTGGTGELYLAGAGLARGYLGRPELTAEKFIPNPFSTAPGQRMYRTADRVRRRNDGNLEFLSRMDHQVKVRGFRIEPGEIEAVLLAHGKAHEAAVITREDHFSETQIVAFVVLDENSPRTFLELRQYMKGLLPFYMRPNRYVALQHLPVNSNGKVDRSSLALLPLPDETREPVLPQTATEEALCKIWADVLKRPAIGVEDDFFALGGHSFLAINLISQIMRYFGHRLAVAEIFQHSTPREMARVIDHHKKSMASSALVCMNKGSEEVPPLYLMHPVGGNILCYSDLVRFFSRQKPFYAVQALPAEHASQATVEEIASGYLQFIKKRDRYGQYELGGWSFGGLLAFELAQKAAASGDPPTALYLFDPTVPEDLPAVQADDDLSALFTLTLITDFSGGKTFDLAKLKADFGLEKRTLEAQLEKATQLGLLPRSLNLAAHAQYFEVFKRNIQAARIYRARKYSGHTVLVLPEMRGPQMWPAVLPADARFARIPGNHFTMLRGSNAAAIASLIESDPGSLSS